MVSGGTVYAGGDFFNIGGQPRNNIAALDATTGAATGWNPNAYDPVGNGQVVSLTVSSGTVYAGGQFTNIGGQQRSRIAALDVATGAATAWDPNPNPLDLGTRVSTLLVSGARVYAGGWFTSIGGLPQSYLAAISTGDTPVATLLAQFEAATSSDGIELHWSFDDASRVATVAVERALDVVGPWLPITPEQHDECGVTVALDRTAGDSGQYFYRLVVRLTDGGRMVVDPVSASHRETPSQSDLTLLSPNPTSGGTQVQYSVARAGRVRLEVLDVSGRVEETLADRIHAPGRYVITWDGAGRHGRVSPGLYFVRLVASRQVTMRKLAIVQ